MNSNNSYKNNIEREDIDISVVVPVYGCKGALRELCERIKTTITQMNLSYEILLVNDNCPQNSWEVIQELCDEDRCIVGIELSRNFGQIKAITAGLDNASGKWIVVMDCDLQDRPEEIPNLYAKAQEGYDVVFARRKNRKDKWLKRFISFLFYKVYSFATDGNYDPALCNFSISRRIVVDNYCKMREYHRAFVIYVKWLGFKQAALDVEHNERKEGKSSYNMKKRMAMAGEILTSQSDKLLKLFVKVGFGMMFLSFCAIVFIICNYFMNNVAVGWSSTIASIFLMGGIMMMTIGLVGIYVGNIFIQTKNRPLYIIRQMQNKETKDD